MYEKTPEKIDNIIVNQNNTKLLYWVYSTT